MKCPVCKDVTLLTSEKKGVEIDYCPECRGIWLDRGELEKLVDAEERAYSNRDRDDRSNRDHHKDDRYDEYDDYRDDKYGHHNRRHRRKRESFLGEIFESFGGDD